MTTITDYLGNPPEICGTILIAMQIKQWEDKNLAQFSYGILSDCEKKIILIDPSRNPQPYLDWAKENAATVVGIIETHPHADFVSSHLELHKTLGATIYTHSLVGASYPHQTFDEGATIEFGKIRLTSLHTPGHSPDSISVLLEHNEQQKAVFTGDTLFIGDCGRPDLREGAGNMKALRADLARHMYHSLREKLMKLNDDVLVYPAHGAGTLCGKSLSKDTSSTIGQEKQTNWSLQEATEDEFVKNLLADQPFIPVYFPYNVELNRKGARAFEESIRSIKFGEPIITEADRSRLAEEIIVVDTRPAEEFNSKHLRNSVNLMEGEKFETWLGSIIKPEEPFYLAGKDVSQLKRLAERAASIGYEGQIVEAFVLESGDKSQPLLDLSAFRSHLGQYTIIDVRNPSEVKNGKPFINSLSLPLPELRDRLTEIPTTKPIVVHCAGGYRSAAASSIIDSALGKKVKVFDLSEAVKEF